MRQELHAALEKADVVATPTAPGAAFGIGEKTDDPLAMYLSDIFTTPASLTGLPAVSVPSGLDDRGLPLSLQLMGRPFEEADGLPRGAGLRAPGELPAGAHVPGSGGG